MLKILNNQPTSKLSKTVYIERRLKFWIGLKETWKGEQQRSFMRCLYDLSSLIFICSFSEELHLYTEYAKSCCYLC